MDLFFEEISANAVLGVKPDPHRSSNATA